MHSIEHKINYPKRLSVYNSAYFIYAQPQFLQITGHYIRQFGKKKNRRRNDSKEFLNIQGRKSPCCQIV